ncbi:hypothetical protein [Halosimplex halophilum]|uniref:hypothetical protein n=1 Tax=Halosimplex halophilum TaxID=2559572 RepID=UPI00107F30C5|nr:hypothetical protein [Halosimplex halophilum]
MTTGERTGEGTDWEPTHEIVSTGDLADEVAADTRLVAVACELGDRAFLTMATDDVGDRSPHTQRILDGRLDRVDDDADRDRVDDGADLDRADATFGGPTWRATLPDEADALVRALTVADPEADGPLGEAHWRRWDVQRVAVHRDGRPVYRSVPHHSRFELDAAELPAFTDRARERLADLPCAVVPTGPVATWGDDGEVNHRAIRFETGSGVSLEHVRRVAVDRDRRELVVDWEPVGERVEREPSRVLRGVLRAFAWAVDRLGGSADPPRRLSFADGDEFRRAVAGIETARERVGYDFEVVEM